MGILSLKKIDFIFSLICVGFVICYAIISFLDFLDNKDVCEVSFKTFHSHQSHRYPSFTMCLAFPFVTEKFDNYSVAVEYISYIMGTINGSKNLENIAYEDVSINESDSIISASVKYKNEGRSVLNITKIRTHSWNMKILFMKCFTFDIPYFENSLADNLKINFNNTIFPDGQRPNDGRDVRGLQIFHHYPRQFGRSFASNRRFWNNRNFNKSYLMRLDMKGMEVLEKRHKKYEECEGDIDFDNVISRHILNTLGCRPPYMDSIGMNFPVCTCKTRLFEAGKLFYKVFYGKSDLKGPCSEISKLDLSYEETDFDQLHDKQIELRLYFLSKEYKEIRQVRAYGLMLLFGNVGGFVGLSLGYALVHLPGSIHATVKYLGLQIFGGKK